jgi:transcriptional antiterminator RfaH
MNPSTDTEWFAIQTRVSRERFAELSLVELGFQTLLPLVRRNPGSWRASKHPTKALFPGYLFACFCPQTHLRVVSYAHGTLRVVSAGERPVPVEPSIIESLQARMNASGCVLLEEQPFAPEEPLCVTTGPFAGWYGVFDKALSDAQRVVILLETLNCCRLVVRTDWVERRAVA